MRLLGPTRTSPDLLSFANNNKIERVIEGERNFYDKDGEPHFVDPLEQTLCNRFDELIRQGLLKSYVIHAENTSSMRGKLLMKHQMQNQEHEQNQVQNDIHLLECETIIDNCPELANNNETEYQDLFDSIELQVKAVKLFMAIYKTKQGIEEEDEKEDS